MLDSSFVSKGEQYHHGNLHAALLNSAQQALENGRLAKLSLRSLARECGVSQTAPYRHFASKEHLLAVLAESGAEKILTQMQTIRKETFDVNDCLVKMMQAYLNFATDNSAHFQLIFNARMVDRANFPSLLRSLHKIEAVFAEPITRLGPGLDIDLTSSMIWAQVHGMSTLQANGVSAETARCNKMIAGFVSSLLASLTPDTVDSTIPA